MWPSSVPSWLHELWWAEVVNPPENSPPWFFSRAHDVFLHGCVRKSKQVYSRKDRTWRDGEIIPSVPIKKEVS